MSKPPISVLVLTYHPAKEALFSTLNSIVEQQDCEYELIVADDGSGNFFEAEIREFLDARGVKDYKILAHPQNQGTVRNILSGVEVANGTYIKPISPGDYLYDEHTLRDIVNFMQEHQAQAAFGKMVFYSYADDLEVKNLTHPLAPDTFRADRENYSFGKALKQQMVYGDFICGASAVYETKTFEQTLNTISPAVRFAEDSVFQLFALENIRIFAIPQYIVWYEHGTGISTAKPTAAFTRIDTDFYNFYHLLAEKFPENACVKRACRFWQLRKDGAGKKLLLVKLCPDKLRFSLQARKIRRTLQITDYCDSFFRKCHITG